MIRLLFAIGLTGDHLLCNGFDCPVGKAGRAFDQTIVEIRNGHILARVTAPRPLLQCLPEVEIMPKLGSIVQKLKLERDRAQLRVDRLNAALAALESVGNQSGRPQKSGVAMRRKPMPAAARKRIAAAQRARWAKWKAAHRKK